MLRGIAIASTAGLMAVACGSDSGQNPQGYVPPPPATSPPPNPMAPPSNPQQPDFNQNAPPPNPQAPTPNQQQPTPAPASGATIPASTVASCRDICGEVASECQANCDVYCDFFSLIGANCSDEAEGLIRCIAAEGIECRQSGNINPPIGRCRNELVDSMQVSEACLTALFGQ